MAEELDILWVKSGPLFPLNTGGRKRTHAMLTELSRKHRVTYLAFCPEDAELDPQEKKDPYAAEKIWIPWKEAQKHSPRFYAQLTRNAAFSRFPYALAKYRSKTMRKEIQNLDHSGQFDLIVCDFLYPAPNITPAALKTPTVLFQHNMEAQLWRRLAENKKNLLSRFYFQSQAKRMNALEQQLSQQFDSVITVSPDDTDYAQIHYGLQNVAGDVPTGVDTNYFHPAKGTPTASDQIAFLGSMDWMPNIEAVQWFAEDIWPRLREAKADVHFTVIGGDPPLSIRKWAQEDPSVTVTGTVHDVRPYLGNASVLAVPLKSGGGTRIKILEAMAMAKPIVSTTVGAEGLGLMDGRHLLIADTAEEFSEKLLCLLNDLEARRSLARSARQVVEEHYTWTRATDQFLEHCLPLLNHR